MSLIEILTCLLMGFGSWWSTGIDDLILLSGILKTTRNRKQVFAVACAQFLGVAVVLVLANCLIAAIRLINLPLAAFELFSGVILIGVGCLIFRSLYIRTTQRITSSRRTTSIAAIAFLVYIFNAADDFAVVTGSFVPLATGSRLILSLGFVVGWMTCFILAYRGSKIKTSWLNKFLAMVLITWGLMRLVSGLTGVI